VLIVNIDQRRDREAPPLQPRERDRRGFRHTGHDRNHRRVPRQTRFDFSQKRGEIEPLRELHSGQRLKDLPEPLGTGLRRQNQWPAPIMLRFP